jgi:hypothetical protein
MAVQHRRFFAGVVNEPTCGERCQWARVMRLLVFVLAIGPAVFASPHAVNYRARPGTPLPCERGVVIAAPVCAAEGTCDVATVTAAWTTSGSPVLFDLADSTSWRINLEADRCWAPELVIATGAASASHEVPVWPEATVHARLLIEKGLELPGTASIAIDDGRSQVMTRCEIKEGEVSCRAPAMNGDIRLEVIGFAPVYAWSRVLAFNARTSLGEVMLKRAASISGRVTVGKRDQTGAGAAVTIRPSEFAQTVEEQRRIDARTRTTRASETGLFQFTDIEPGRYEVRAAKDGWSPSEIVTMTVEAGREAVLPRSLLLDTLVNFETAISPPVAPGGERWIVSLQNRGEARKTIQAPAGEDGRWSAEGLEAGHYEISIVDRSGTVFFRLATAITPAHSFLPITVEGVVIRGRVTRASEPVEGRITFSKPRAGPRSTFVANGEGAFAGVLPGEGEWRVEVTLTGKESPIRGPLVEVRRGEDGVASVDIELPAGRIKGRVVDESGSTAAARIRVYSEDGAPLTTDRTAEDGGFSIEGLPPGEVKIQALARDRDSGLVPHRVRETDADAVTLVLRPIPRVRGWLTTRSGRAVGGATIRYWSDSFAWQKERVSGPDGEFSLPVLPSDREIVVVIVAPPFPTRMLKVPVDGHDHEIVLDRPAGTLLIKARDYSGVFVRRGPVTAGLLSMSAPGIAGIPPQEWTARGWALSVEPGEYFVCREYFAPSDRCDRVTIVAGGEHMVIVENADELPRGVR